MGLIIEIAGFDRHPNRDIDGICKFCDADCNLFFVRPMIMAIAIFSKLSLSAMKNNAGPVHVDVHMLKIISLKKDVLEVRGDFIPVGTKDFKDTIQCSFAEGREIKFSKNFRAVDPFVRSFYAEVIRQFITDKSSDGFVDIYPIFLVFPENIGEIEDFVMAGNGKEDYNRKGYIFIGLNLNRS